MYTVPELAQLLGLTERQVRYRIKVWQLPYVRKGRGAAYLVSLENFPYRPFTRQGHSPHASTN